MMEWGEEAVFVLVLKLVARLKLSIELNGMGWEF